VVGCNLKEGPHLDSSHQGLNPTLCCEGLLQNLAMWYQQAFMPWNHILNTPRHCGSCLYHAMTLILLVMNICTSTLGMELMGNA
jgi:hypothetical protein